MIKLTKHSILENLLSYVKPLEDTVHSLQEEIIQKRSRYYIAYIMLKKWNRCYYYYYYYYLVILLLIIMLICPVDGVISLTPMTTLLVSGNFIGLFVGFCNARSVVIAPLCGIS